MSEQNEDVTNAADVTGAGAPAPSTADGGTDAAGTAAAPKRRPRRATSRTTAPEAAATAPAAEAEGGEAAAAAPAGKAPARRTPRKRATTATTEAAPAAAAEGAEAAADAAPPSVGPTPDTAATGEADPGADDAAPKARARRSPARTTRSRAKAAAPETPEVSEAPAAPAPAAEPDQDAAEPITAAAPDEAAAEAQPTKPRARRRATSAGTTKRSSRAAAEELAAVPADQPASAETGDQAPPADQAAPADAGDQAASADGVGQAPPAPTTDQAAPDQAAGSTAGPDTAGPTRPARRSRRATSAPRTPEQRLDVLAELGLAQPSAAPTPPTSVDDAEEEAEATAAQDDTATGAAPVDTGDDDAAVATPPADTTAATDPDAATAASPAATLDEEGEGPRLPAAALLFQAPDLSQARPRRRRATAPAGAPAADARAEAPTTEAPTEAPAPGGEPADQAEPAGTEAEDTGEEQTAARRRRRRGGRGRRNRSAEDETTAEATGAEPADKAETEPAHAQAVVTEPASAPAGGAEPVTEREPAEQDDGEEGGGSRRRRRRRRSGRSETEGARSLSDEVTALKGSTRLEAKRQRRREGREAGRRRPTISEAEFLARRESVTRTMVVREKEGLNQIAVLEDNILVEHYVARHTQSSMVGNVYLGRVQNVLPSMEAAFVDLGKGRNAVLYAGEVNWDAAGLEGQPRRIEQALKSGDTVLVQVTKDPIGHKGARLTSQITLAGRHLVLVPSGAMTGISRKLPDTERARLKKLLKEIVPDGAGVIVRTAAEGASEEQLRADVDRLVRQWADIEAKAKAAKSAPVLLRGEPELAVRVVRDVFNEDFESLVVAGDTAWETISAYVADLSPDLADRLHHWTAEQDVFAAYRVDEQLAKAMDRKVWLPSGGSLVIDRTEAMTVIDVNTGKFTGSGGTLEETVTRNNLEAAEEIVRQLRLRDIGGIIVIDFIDMVLESNRELVMRRLLECLGRDRTRHQVAEVTSLGLVQMTRKRVGQGLVEAFSTPCEHCNGRGFIVHDHPVERTNGAGGGPSGNGARDDGGSRRRGRRTPPPAEAAPEPRPAPAEDPAAQAAREAVKATLATIAAAAASAHSEHAEGGGPDAEPAPATPQSPDGAAEEAAAPAGEPVLVSADADAQAPETQPAREPVEAGPREPVGGPPAAVEAAPREAGQPAETPAATEAAPAAAPARRPRRSRRAMSTGVVTPGQTSIVTVDAGERE